MKIGYRLASSLEDIRTLTEEKSEPEFLQIPFAFDLRTFKF